MGWLHLARHWATSIHHQDASVELEQKVAQAYLRADPSRKQHVLQARIFTCLPPP
eukprot:CAMPEP_0119327974 /NCGR_PEP_ID=MMETSP1333-20130426/72104_1 /TAXON_ID=418940 /ORGANISM="Scyphosphaera apsteinii, Strain RCC1455" /LENGTH=54 /DNA_ID=CAMNT_0007336707 /DNA_START=118 /DNA_END=279 /DNA_ORIENTATION=+